jgi:hypothetical protein
MVLCKSSSSQQLNQLACERQAPGMPCWPLWTGRQAQQRQGDFMRKFAIIATTFGLLAGATGGVSIASAAPHTAAAPLAASASSATVLHLLSRQTSLNVLDLGKKGPGPGDQIMESTSEVQNGKVIGHGFLNCVGITVREHRFHVLCHGAIVFADGQLEFQGEIDFQTPFTVGVIGGTGAYQHAGGQLTVERTLPDGTTDVETLRLIFFETG